MIPKPVSEIKIIEDKRGEYLNGWKKLFESADPSIKVILYCDDGFNDFTRSILSENEFFHSLESVMYVLFEDNEIVFRSYHYLCGNKHGKMFSSLDVDRDVLQNPDLTCDPEEDTWENWYNEVCVAIEAYRRKIPKPPKSKTPG